MAMSYEKLIRLICRQIDDVYGNPSVAARAVGDYFTDKGESVGNCAPTMYRIYNWTPDGQQPKRSTLLKYAQAMNISLSEEADEAAETDTMTPMTEDAQADWKARTKKVVSDCIDNFQTPEAGDVIEKTARGLVKVEKRVQKGAAGEEIPEVPAGRKLYAEGHVESPDNAMAAEGEDVYGQENSGI